jgi:cobalt-zinc-cadmium efflux system outer membrane protein
MRSEVLALSLLAAGCVSTSIRADLDEIQQITDAVAMADVEGDVDPETVDDARTLLATPLDADAAVRIALLNNRELRAELREVGVARAELLQAGFLPNPLLELEVAPERNSDVELRVEWDLAGLILAPLRADVATAHLEVARLGAARSLVETGYAVRTAFHTAQAAEERLAIAQRALDASAAARDAARALGAAGNLRALDVAAREAEFEEERIRVAELELELLVAREAVQRLLGLHGDETTWTIAAPLAEAPAEPFDPPDLERTVIDASLGLREMRSEMERIGRRAGLARVEGLLPEILVDVHTLIGNSSGTSTGTLVGGGVAMRLPVFDQAEGTVAAYEHALDAAIERYVGMAIDVRSSAREARARALSARARSRHYADAVLVARQRVLDETLLQYDAMQVSIFQLLDAVHALLDSQLAAVETRREYWSAAAALGAVIAGQVVEPSGMRRTTSAHVTRGEEH